MFKQRKCCDNPKYETVSSFYTYKEKEHDFYEIGSPYRYTTITVPDFIIDRIGVIIFVQSSLPPRPTSIIA